MRKLQYIIEPEYDGFILENYLMGIKGYSRRIITRLKLNKPDISLNGQHIRMVDTIKTGDVLDITLREERCVIPNSETEVPIVYEDDDIIVYNKPPNMPVHPSSNHQTDTLANVFSHYMQTKGEIGTFRPINRLDKDTSGLCLVAKNSLAASKLRNCVKKEYTAVVCGEVIPLIGTINAPIIRPNPNSIIRTVGFGGKEAITHYKAIKIVNNYSLVCINLETGRTHQIRVHFSHMGYPLAGDELYGGSLKDIQRQALCCTKLNFIHPYTNMHMNLCINIQDDMNDLVNNA